MDASQGSPVSQFMIDQAATCLGRQSAGATKGGTTTVSGRRAVEVKLAGTLPGTEPGSLFVALDGPPLPLRSVTTGAPVPGGDQGCSSGSDTGKAGGDNLQADFTYPPTAPTITPPPNAQAMCNGVVGPCGGGTTDTPSPSP
jgi:hypothetical protein